MWEESWPSEGVPSHFYEQTWKIAPAILPLKEEVIGSVGNVLWVVMATIGVVMLIACTNVANLLLVRADGRQQELAVRAALGASRGRIAWELLLESVALGLIGGVLGIAIAYEGLRLLVAIGPANLPRLGEISLDGRSLGFTLALSLFSGLLFGSIPVLRYVGRRMPTALRGHGKNRERKPGTATLPRSAGGGPGGYGYGVAGKCHADDSYLPGSASCRARILAAGTSADHAHLYPAFPDRGPATGYPHAKQHRRQVGRDSGRHLGGVRGRGADGWNPIQLERGAN